MSVHLASAEYLFSRVGGADVLPLRDDRRGGSAAPGCYERVYDPAHLAAHPGQLVVRATVLVKPPDAAEAAALGAFRAVRADLRIWLKGQKPSFDSFGACRVANGGLSCGGSVSAAEADDCKTDRDGVHRNCRIIRAANTGAFGIVAQSDGPVVTIQRQLACSSAL